MDTIVILARVLHGWTRWILIIVAAVALVTFALGLLQGKPWTKRAHQLLNAYGSIFGLQWLFGLVLLIAWGSMTTFSQRHLWEHLAVQTVAMFVANMHHMWRRREMPDSKRWRNGLLVLVVSLILAVVGILALPVDIQWRFFLPQ